MTFQKGHIGRPKGAMGKPEIASLKTLLSDAFIRNRSAAIKKIDQMFQQADLTDFKWLCQVKASLEPREAKIEHTNLPENKIIVVYPTMKEPNASSPESLSREIPSEH